MTKFDDYAREVTELVRAIGPLLAGKPPAVQSAALADLLAIWVVGHRDRRGNKKTALEFQEIVLTYPQVLEYISELASRRAAQPSSESDEHVDFM